MERSSKDELNDDYVAQLLAQDAKQTSQRYVSQGLSAFLPTRRAAHIPKPNTRFLSHIVREADNHNASLKRKEEHEAERRLELLRAKDQEPAPKRRRADETDVSRRNRMLGDIASAARSKPSDRFRTSDEKRVSKQDHSRGNRHEKPSKRHQNSKSRSRSRSRSPSRERSSYHRSEKPHRLSRHRSRSPDSNHVRGARKQKSSRLSTSENISGSNHDAHSETNVTKRSSPPRSGTPVTIRGRGAHTQRSRIDDRFAQDYDPLQDVNPDSDEEDWDLALEAMRDRTKYRQNQAARMREAGFDEKDISIWEKSFRNSEGNDQNLKNVKWSRQGEVREWDAGKVDYQTDT